MKTDWSLHARRLRRLLGVRQVIADPARCKTYAGDKWFAAREPDLVVLPRHTADVSRLMRYASRNRLDVTPRGAGHGYVGGCVPVRGGIVVSLERLNRIREVHAGDFVAVVQPAVLTKSLQDAVEKAGLYYPPDPASRADCSLGGNIATNAGGPRCLKYGVTRDYVLGLEVVLPDGAVCRLGSRCHKNKTGFDLHRLFVGSEGMLGIVTEATLKLLPLPPFRVCLGVGFANAHAATRALTAIFSAGFLPCALEIADQFTLAAARKRTGSRQLEGCNAMLFVELDGQEASVRGELRKLERILRGYKPRFVNRAVGAAQVEQLWGLRREFSYSLRDTGLTKLNEDVVVPRSRLEDLFKLAARLQRRHRLPVACFGHAGDGNIHVNVMVDYDARGAKRRSEKCLDELFKQVIRWGGVVTGEHGIGLAKKPWWKLAAPKEVRALHQTIKTALDPSGILNPGKFLG
ncbi:MAG TPA: FAD/FMN-containing dehydrogenase [Verrucomicrobiales bacterium]|nr:FAD/FMN-containing dehydrogenase [Verrucomicrobiales bacterium]